MHIVNDAPLMPAWLVTKIRSQELCGVFIVKGTFDLKLGEIAAPTSEPLSPTGDEPLRYATDFAPFKPNTDLLLTGTCFPPGDKAVSVSSVSFRVGSWSKALAVVGNRTLKRGRVAGPEPFRKMAVTYESAYGGPSFARNPFGVGHREETAPDGAKIRRLPNIVYPRDLSADPDSRLEAAAFGPLPVTVPERMGKAGTYDKSWLKKNWPWLPEDFDWTYFNAAPRDQQLPTYLKGDEELVLENLHPVHARYSAKLPAVRARCFLHERIGTEWEFREVPLRLDTLWVDMDSEKLVLVWRGHVPVKSLRMPELRHVYLASEPLQGHPLGLEEHRRILNERLPERFRFMPVPMESPPVAVKEEASVEEELKAMDKELAGLEAQVAKNVEEAKSQLVSAGADPTLFSPPSAPPMDFASAVKAFQSEASRSLAELRTAAPGTPALIGLPGKIELPDIPSQIEDPAEPPPWSRETVEEGIRNGVDFTRQDLGGLDLSGLDLRDARFAEARLNGAVLAKTDLRNADLRGASLRGTVLTESDLSHAKLDEADFTGATLRRAKAIGASVPYSDFSRADLVEADFAEAVGKGCRFAEANASRASFRGAKIPVSVFEEGVLERADFTDADLRGASFEGSKAPGVVMVGTDVTRLHAGEAPDFSGGRFRSLRGSESTWEGARLDAAEFAESNLIRADFTGASLTRTVFLRCEMKKARFPDASLQGARILQCDVCDGLFEGADLAGTDWTGSNFYNAEFWRAKTEGARRGNANLKGTKLTEDA